MTTGEQSERPQVRERCPCVWNERVQCILAAGHEGLCSAATGSRSRLGRCWHCSARPSEPHHPECPQATAEKAVP